MIQQEKQFLKKWLVLPRVQEAISTRPMPQEITTQKAGKTGTCSRSLFLCSLSTSVSPIPLGRTEGTGETAPEQTGSAGGGRRGTPRPLPALSVTHSASPELGPSTPSAVCPVSHKPRTNTAAPQQTPAAAAQATPPQRFGLQAHTSPRRAGSQLSECLSQASTFSES